MKVYLLNIIRLFIVWQVAWKTWLANWSHDDYPEPDPSDIVAYVPYLLLI